MKRNIALCFVLRFTWNFLLVQAVMVPFFHRRGLTDARIFWVQSFFALVLLVSDVPTGFLSDRLGRRTALILAGIFKGLGGTALIYANGFTQLVGSYVLIGMANSLLSGTDVALLYESHLAIDGKKPTTAALQSRAHVIGIVSVTAAAIVGGVLAHRSLDLAVQVNAAFAWLSLVVALFVVEPKRAAAPRSAHLSRVTDAARKLLLRDADLRWLALATVALSVAPQLAIYAYQRLWADLAFPLSWFGALAAIQSVTSAVVGLWLGGAKQTRKRVAPAIALALPVLAFAGASVNIAAVAVASVLVLEVVRTLVQVVLIDRINLKLSHDRATANSILSFGGRVLVVAIGPVIGFLIETQGVRAAFAFLFALYAVFGLVLGVVHVSGQPKTIVFGRNATSDE